MFTNHQEKYLAWELTKRHNSSDEEKLTSVLSEAKVDLNPHQVEAALFAFRSPLSMGAILADEVGLGKTIEAALVISQKWAERKRHILIISPATLRKQWNVELEDKFFLPSVILERKNFNQILNDSYSNPFQTTDNIVICSYPFARKQIDHINRVKWDLIVIDEAHSLRNVYKNNKTGTALKYGLQPFKKILLTATPLQNDIKELYGLISIIDNNYFGSLDGFSSQYNKVALREDETYIELRNRIQPVVHRTLRSQVQAYVKYTNRIPLVQEYSPSMEETELSNRINAYLHKEDCYGMPRSQRNLITLVLYKLLASSSFAIAGTLNTIIERLQKAVDKHSSSDDIEEYIDDKELLADYAEEWIDEEDEEKKDNIKEEKHYTDDDIENIKVEIEELKSIYQLAISIASNSKGECLIQALGYGFMHMDDMGAPHKALIFTESTRTQQYLLNLLETNGYKGKIALFNGSNNDPKSKEIYSNWITKHKGSSRITGSKTADKRQALVDYFRDEAEIMIATEAAAEGINLQFCSLIVNYDLPWNPQRVEQRIGRCHRYGQKHDVVVVNFINIENQADKRVYELLDQKFQLFKGVFGASDDVLGAIGNGLDFEKRILAILQKCRTTQQIDEEFDKLQAEMRDMIEQDMQQTCVSLFENFDEEVIEKLRMRESSVSERLSKFTRQLWSLTKSVLTDKIEVLDNNNLSFKLFISPTPSIPKGIYTLTKEPTDGYTYRTSHPLAKWVVEKAKQTSTPSVEIEFDYSKCEGKISVIEQNRGNSGNLAARFVRYTSLGEVEEHVILSATDSSGVRMDDNFAPRLLSLSAKIVGVIGTSQCDAATTLLDEQQNTLSEKLEIRNSELVNDEVVKIEHWAEDNRKELQRMLTELDKAIDEKNGEFIRERNIRKKLAIQKEKDALSDKRDLAWRDYDEKREELKAEKNRLITQLYEMADGKIEVVDEFLIKWKIK